jgi:hypothetical protein
MNIIKDLASVGCFGHAQQCASSREIISVFEDREPTDRFFYLFFPDDGSRIQYRNVAFV